MKAIVRVLNDNSLSLFYQIQNLITYSFSYGTIHTLLQMILLKVPNARNYDEPGNRHTSGLFAINLVKKKCAG